MRKFTLKETRGPEEQIRDEIVAMLKVQDWLVKITHGNLFQYGLPDLYCAHHTYGQRWVEVKNPDSYSFTPAQLKFFPELNAKGVGVWILVAATAAEYDKLFKPQNWLQYLMVKM